MLKEVNKETGGIGNLVAGGTLYADTPVGSIMPFGGNIIPSGWLACSGQAISRTDYAELFAVIGTYYGSGNGTTTFNVPDLREATPKGTGLSGKSNAHYSVGGITLGQFVDDQFQQWTATFDNINNIPTCTGIATYNQNGSEEPANTNNSGGKITLDPSRTARTGTTTEVKAVGVNFIIKAKNTGVPADFSDVIQRAIDTALQEYPKRYKVDGYILNGDVIRGYGRANVMLYANGQAVVEYACRVTTANTASDVFEYGISPKIISQLNSSIPLITPEAGGTVMYYRTGVAAGVLYPQQDLVHFCGTHNTVIYLGDTYWQLARLYSVGTAPGGWPTRTMPLDTYIQGTCYGTFTV